MAEKPSHGDAPSALVPDVDDPSRPFVARWHELVSVTNWEKGRIIFQWRQSLVEAEVPAAEYADEAWADRVGNVTGQHVGRLRRVFQRFGGVYADYPGLYWSHFQVALDWDDAEMWLEGAVHSGWSISQMRAQRWEAHGAPESLKSLDEDIIVSVVDEDADALLDDNPRLTSRTVTVRGVGSDSDGHRKGDCGDEGEPSPNIAGRAERRRADEPQAVDVEERKRPFEDLPSLPDDLAEAFEQFKLVILTHKMSGWVDISRDDLLACLDALKELALQPAGD